MDGLPHCCLLFNLFSLIDILKRRNRLGRVPPWGARRNECPRGVEQDLTGEGLAGGVMSELIVIHFLLPHVVEHVGAISFAV